MVCKKCGIEMSAEERYCIRCGHDQTVEIVQEASELEEDSVSVKSGINYKNLLKPIIIILVIFGLCIVGSSIRSIMFIRESANSVHNMHNTVTDALTPTVFP